MRRAILCQMLLLLLSGCGTGMSMYADPAPYSGVVLDAQFVSNLARGPNKELDGDSQGWATFFGVISIIDMPFSFVADTVLLPVTLQAASDNQTFKKAVATDGNRSETGQAAAAKLP